MNYLPRGLKSFLFDSLNFEGVARSHIGSDLVSYPNICYSNSELIYTLPYIGGETEIVATDGLSRRFAMTFFEPEIDDPKRKSYLLKNPELLHYVDAYLPATYNSGEMLSKDISYRGIEYVFEEGELIDMPIEFETFTYN